MKNYVPKRGDILWLDHDPQSGVEQKGRRPALCLSPEAYNKRVGLGIFFPITTKVKGYPFEVEIPEKLKIIGVIHSDKPKSADWRSRNAEFICTLPNEFVAVVSEKLSTLIWEDG